MTIIDYEGGIHRDTAILGKQVYYADNGRGQGCGTVWYPSVEQAHKVIKKLGKAPEGQDSGLCEQCSCHYSSRTEEYKKYPEFACRQWKKQL